MSEPRQDVPELIQDLTCDDIIKCQKARRALVAMGAAAVRPLVKALHSEKHWVRWEAAKALSQIASPSSTQALVNALEDNEFDVRWLAAEGLAHIGRPAVTLLLTALIKRPQSVWLREGAHHVLHEMDKGSLDKVLKPVMKALEAPEPTVALPSAARKALEALR